MDEDKEQLPNLGDMRREAHNNALRSAREVGSRVSTAMDSRPAKPRPEDIEIKFPKKDKGRS